MDGIAVASTVLAMRALRRTVKTEKGQAHNPEVLCKQAAWKVTSVCHDTHTANDCHGTNKTKAALVLSSQSDSRRHRILWSTVSNAADKSSKTAAATPRRSTAFKRSETPLGQQF